MEETAESRDRPGAQRDAQGDQDKPCRDRPDATARPWHMTGAAEAQRREDRTGDPVKGSTRGYDRKRNGSPESTTPHVSSAIRGTPAWVDTRKPVSQDSALLPRTKQHG
jgi:hypothetical protein